MSKNVLHVFILIILAYVFLIAGNGFLSLTNPDEVFYAQTAREMTEHNSWITPMLFDQPQFEKPIFTYWLLCLSRMVFGDSPFGYRLFPGLFGIAGVIGVYLLALYGFKQERKALLSGLLLLSSGLYIGLSRFVFTDMIFSVFILFSLVSFYRGFSVPQKHRSGWLWFFVFAALATLTKGPLGIVIPLAVVLSFLAIKRRLDFCRSRGLIAGIFLFALISVPWYWSMIKTYGQAFIHEFFWNDHIRRFIQAEHLSNDRWYFYPLGIIAGVFPWSFFLLASCRHFLNMVKRGNDFYLLLSVWIAAVFLIFQPAHSKLVSYVMPLYPALALIMADFLDYALKTRKKMIRWLCAVTVGLVAILPVAGEIAKAKYPMYVPEHYRALSLIFVIFSLAGALLLWRKKSIAALSLLSGINLLFIIAAVFLRPSIEPYISSEKAGRILGKMEEESRIVLCSKPFARGIRFYTGKDVAVLDFSGNNYFSPHPIAFYGSEKAVKDFLYTQPVTYCVLERSAAEDLVRMTAKELKPELLEIVGDVYLLRMER